MDDTRDNPPAAPQPRRDWTMFLVLALVALCAFSEHLAFNRIFQVDELQNIFTARLLATKQAANYAASANLMLLGPMTWIAGSIDRSALLLRCERLLFFALFWVNLCLIAHCAGLRLRSRRGLLALIVVATLAPLWDYGFEVRHETPLLTAILLAWSLARPLAPNGERRLFLVGLLAVIAQFIAFKAFVYTIPIVLFALIAASLEEKRPLWRALGALLTGAATGFAAGLGAHWLAGTWTFYSSDAKALGSTVFKMVRFSPLPALSRLIFQAPLLLIGVACAVYVALRDSRLKSIVSRDSLLPEVALLAVAIVAIFANPTPFPYNLVLVVPQAAILCLRLDPLAWSSNRLWKPALGLLFIAHLFFWLNATRRHLYMTNARQMELATTAEDLTDPRLHAVLDGTGLVPTRHPPGRYWLIHSFTIHYLREGIWPSVRSQLAEGRTPVLIPSYRLAALPFEDHQYIARHYVAYTGDFLLAGRVLEPFRPTEWECLVPGRYYVTGSVVVDGRLVKRGVLTLDRGAHTLNSADKVYLLWLGPRLDAPPELGPGDASRVFVNFY
jgi:hypothetical protein